MATLGSDYESFYELMALLDQDPRLIPAEDLYDTDADKLYAAMMHRLAQPINGQPSPFSSMAPGTAHAILIGAIAYMQSLLGHQLNVKTWRELLLHFRLMGVTLNRDEYPIISLTFEGRAGATIPAGLEVRSRIDPGLSVYTTRSDLIQGTGDGTTGQVNVPARFNRTGLLPDVRVGEFSVMPRSLSQVNAVYNNGVIIYAGKQQETVSEATLRARQQFQTGMRALTARDYYRFAIDLGAAAAAVIPGIQYGAEGYYGDLVTLAIYPREQASIVADAFASGTNLFQGIPAGTRLDVIPADIIPVNGTVVVRADPQLSDFEVFNRAATAIAATLNPPYGTWGDPDFAQSLAVTLENVDGIYAVPTTTLKNSETNEPLTAIAVKPWHLFEVRQSLVIEVLR